MAELSYSWKGDNAGYDAIHIRIRKLLPRPEKCNICHERPARELSNKDHKYSMNVEDWQWVCSKCHMLFDGRQKYMIQNTPEKYSSAAKKGWKTRRLKGWIHPFKNKWRYRKRDSKGRFL